MRRCLILIGPINIGNLPLSGDTMKNQLFVKRFSEIYEDVIPIDTIKWKQHPWVLIRMIWHILYHPNADVILSANPGGADRIIKILKFLHLDNRLHYWVVGGSIHKSFDSGKLNIKNYSGLKAIIVQGISMAESLSSKGLKNAFYVPNSKYIDYLPFKNDRVENVVHFVFLSRLEQYKGCDEIIKASKILDEDGYNGKYDITFYGKTIEEKAYYQSFINQISNRSEIKYLGPLNLRDTKNYDELSRYDVMLFPTYWQGEGFPGVVIDAFISGMPIIASDWNLNREVITDGLTGWIIPVHDVHALAEKMKYVIDNPLVLKAMVIDCQNKARDYDSRVVLSEENLRNLGLLC